MILEAENVSKTYGEKEVLQNVSFSFDGGIMGFIGPNGAGKSTLIKIILGLVTPNGGTVQIQENTIGTKRSEIMRSIGVLHEKCFYPPKVKGSEYLKFMGQYKNVTIDDLKNVCEFVGIQDYVHNPIGSYSAGMLQRFGFAEAIVGFPPLVILDEPTSNLDPVARREILKKIRFMHEEYGMNFIVSTHILSELEKVCTHIMILNSGVQLACGRMDEYIRKMGTSDLEEIFISILGVE